MVKLHKSHNNPGAFFVQNVESASMRLKMKISSCNYPPYMLYYTQVEAIQTTQAEAEVERTE